MRRQWFYLSGVILGLATISAHAADPADVPRRFVNNLYELHKHLVSTHDIRTESENGGYGGLRGDPNFYKEIRYFDKKSGRLLSKIQWENKHPENIHTIEVRIFDNKGRLARDYSAAYLPNARNAPFQTLIGLRYFGDTLTGYRQYDAAGNTLFEECTGMLNGNKLRIALDYEDIPDDPSTIADATERAAYPLCIGKLPKHPGRFLDPTAEIQR